MTAEEIHLPKMSPGVSWNETNRRLIGEALRRTYEMESILPERLQDLLAELQQKLAGSQ